MEQPRDAASSSAGRIGQQLGFGLFFILKPKLFLPSVFLVWIYATCSHVSLFCSVHVNAYKSLTHLSGGKSLQLMQQLRHCTSEYLITGTLSSATG